MTVGILAAALAIFSQESVFALVSYAWGGMGAAFGPATILALYWRRFNFWGALASIVVGTAVSSLWIPLSGGPWGMLDAEPATPGFVAATLAAVAATLVTPPPSEEAVALFDRVNPKDSCSLPRRSRTPRRAAGIHRISARTSLPRRK